MKLHWISLTLSKVYLKMNRIILCFLFLLLPILAKSQELRCNIQITSSKVQGTNRQIFQTLQVALNEFMNGRTWSNYKYTNTERIECSMLFNIQNYSVDQFTGTLQVQVRRPVYNSSYNSVLFNYVDNDLDFRYIEYQPLEFSETSHLSNLTS